VKKDVMDLTEPDLFLELGGRSRSFDFLFVGLGARAVAVDEGVVVGIALVV